ncbi:MAG: hypothetical protein Q8N37_02610 [bacterium]|nr:hypothetical protein [bacterium]
MEQKETNKIEQIKQKVKQAVDDLDISSAEEITEEVNFNLSKLLELPENNEQGIEEYSNLLICLKLVRLPFLKDTEMTRFIKESLVGALNVEEINIMERIETRQLLFPRETRLEMVNQPIMEALHENNEQIGGGKIFVTGANNPEMPTIKNWLLDYDRTHGTEPQKDLTWLDYAKKNAISARLNTSQADTLRKLLKLYEWLKREPVIE